MPNEQTASPESGPVDTGGADTSIDIGSSAPESAPEPSSGAESSGQKDLFEGFDFSSMDFADQAERLSHPAPKSEQSPPDKKPVTKKAEAKPAVEQPVEQQPKVAEPKVQESETPAPTQEQPPKAQGPATDYSLQLQKNREKALEELTKFYAIDEKAAERYEQEPAKFLSEMAARLHLAVLENAYQSVLQRLPQLTYSTLEARDTYQKAEDRFYSAWPAFERANPEHQKVLQTYGTLFRQQHPNASEAEFTKFVGSAAAAHLGIGQKAAPPAQKRKAVPHNPAAATGASGTNTGASQPKPTQIEEMLGVFASGRV